MEKLLSGCPTECASSHLISFLCHPFLCHPFLCQLLPLSHLSLSPFVTLCHSLSLFVTLCHPFSPFSLFPLFHIIFQRFFSLLYQCFCFSSLFFQTFRPSIFQLPPLFQLFFFYFFDQFFNLFILEIFHPFSRCFLPFFVFNVFQFFNFFAGRKCLMLVVFMRRMMSTLQWCRPETNVSFQPTRCLSANFLRRPVARKCCSSQVSLCHSTRCLVCCMRNGARSAPRNLTRHRLSAYSGDLLTPSLDSRLHQSSKRVLHTIHLLSL